MDVQNNRVLPRIPDSGQQTQRAEQNLRHFNSNSFGHGQPQGIKGLFLLLLPLLLKLLQTIGGKPPEPQPPAQPVYGAPINELPGISAYGVPTQESISSPGILTAPADPSTAATGPLGSRPAGK